MKHRCRVLLLLIAGLTACDAGMSQADDEFVARAIIDACQQLNRDYVIARDLPDPEAYAATFADDGELVVPGGTYRGRTLIAERLREAAKTTVTMHFLSTSNITVHSATRATGVTYVTVFVEPKSEEAGAPVPTSGPAAIGAYYDEYELTERGWKFKRREFKPKFSWERAE